MPDLAIFGEFSIPYITSPRPEKPAKLLPDEQAPLGASRLDAASVMEVLQAVIGE